jgi:guanyl-specific ribonuclease Sa
MYHGAVRPGLKEITPVAARGSRAQATYDNHPPDQAYATADKDTAWKYAENAWSGDEYARRPRVYQVIPMGPIEHDPDPTAFGNRPGHLPPDKNGLYREGTEPNANDYQSKSGFRVLRQEQFPKDWGSPEDWDR